MAKNSKESIELRRKNILDIIASSQIIKLETLINRFDASAVTIRRDINKLIKDKMIQKDPDGTISLKQDIAFDANIYQRYSAKHNEKIQIAKEAIQLVKPGDVIGIDGSTTALEFSKKLLTCNDITVITNNLLIPPYLTKHESLTLFSVGGQFLQEWISTEGVAACTEIQKYRYNSVFLSVSALDLNYGLSHDKPEEIDTKVSFLKCANTRILLIDSSKIGNRALKKIWPIDQIDIVVTDDKISTEYINEFEKHGIKLIIAKNNTPESLSKLSNM